MNSYTFHFDNGVLNHELNRFAQFSYAAKSSLQITKPACLMPRANFQAHAKLCVMFSYALRNAK